MKVLPISITPIMNSVTNPIELIRTFCIFDDLSVLIFGKTHRGRPNSLSRSEVATIVLPKQTYQ